MPKYFFTAKSQKGKSYSDTREARDKSELARILRQEGYVLISATIEEEDRSSFKNWQENFSFFSRVSFRDKMMLTRNLQVMISAGISLPQSLRTLALQSKSKKLKKVLLEVTEEVIKGKSFSDSISRYPDIFSELFCSMVKVGEESGSLEENLTILIRQMEREYALKSSIKGAMMYPAVIIATMTGVGVLMLVMVVPQLAQSFDELGIVLPPTTRMVIALGNFFTEKWYLVVLFFIIFIFSGRLMIKTKKGKKIVDGLVLKLPIISPIVKKTNAAYTVRTLASLIGASIPMLRSLEIVAGALGNFYFKEAILQAVEKIKRGERLSQALKPYRNLYPPTVIQMIEVGEETGETSDILQKLGDFFEEEVSQATKNLVAIIEPILMLVIGGVVGFFAVSMVQPMYSMLGSL